MATKTNACKCIVVFAKFIVSTSSFRDMLKFIYIHLDSTRSTSLQYIIRITSRKLTPYPMKAPKFSSILPEVMIELSKAHLFAKRLSGLYLLTRQWSFIFEVVTLIVDYKLNAPPTHLARVYRKTYWKLYEGCRQCEASSIIISCRFIAKEVFITEFTSLPSSLVE